MNDFAEVQCLDDYVNQQQAIETDLFRRAADVIHDAQERPITTDEATLLRYLIGV